MSVTKGQYPIKLHEKIFMLHKQSGMSWKGTANRFNLSRQSLLRWENGTEQPTANNIAEISKLFGITADCLLNDGIRYINFLFYVFKFLGSTAVYIKNQSEISESKSDKKEMRLVDGWACQHHLDCKVPNPFRFTFDVRLRGENTICEIIKPIF